MVYVIKQLVLVNNAGNSGKMHLMMNAWWAMEQKLSDTSLHGFLYVTHIIVNRCKPDEKKYGRIINIALSGLSLPGKQLLSSKSNRDRRYRALAPGEAVKVSL